MKELRNKVAVVTGASRGLGAHIARALAEEGVHLVLVARSGEPLAALARELSGTGVRAVPIAADLAQLDLLDGVIDEASLTLGPVDLLINNAALEGIRFFTEESAQQTELMVRVNLLVPMLLTRKVLPSMIARGMGHIVNIGSLAGKASNPFSVSYNSAKAGLISFTHCLRAELRGTGVSASVITPGFIAEEGMFSKQQRAHDLHVSPLLGTSSIEDVVRAVLRAVTRDRAEIPVSRGPVRLLQALSQISPAALSWIETHLLGLPKLLHPVALAERTDSGRNE